MNKKIINFDPKDLIFDDKVVEACKSCKRYGKKLSCPPNIKPLSYYKRVLKRYSKGIFIVEYFNIDKKTSWQELGKQSSLTINEDILSYRDKLFNKGHFFVNCFGAGSCKRCEQCGTECKFPDKRLIPIEGTGIDLVNTLLKIDNFKITFPVNKYFYRIGMIVYD